MHPDKLAINQIDLILESYDRLTPPCQACMSLRSPVLNSTMYPSSPLSAVMKTKATSLPLAVVAAVSRSESLKLDDITVLSDLDRFVMASKGYDRYNQFLFGDSRGHPYCDKIWKVRCATEASHWRMSTEVEYKTYPLPHPIASTPESQARSAQLQTPHH